MTTKNNSVLKATTNAELLSYIINETPILKENIDLPKQGESVAPIGKLIVDNTRYRNAFINTINLIGLTIIKRNQWENPWEVFANRGVLKRGQQIREIIQDLAKVYDYNENYDNKHKFLDTEVPQIYQYIHNLNFQKFYEVTINESELYMAFDDEESGLLDFITSTIENLYTTYDYDKYLIDKYQLCRRLVDGTVRSIKIDSNLNPREILSKMKGVSNKMTFMSPNYNPAGIRRAVKQANQYLMLDAEREAINSTEILATSYFKDEAQTKTNLALIDSFSETDENRLALLLKDAYVPFTEAEKTMLSNVLGVIISDEFFMDYYYALDNTREDGKRQTEFENPTTLEKSVFLHVWLVLSTSPFENCAVFTTETPSVTSVALSPSSATVSKGQGLQLTSTVVTTGLANKSVIYSVSAGRAEVNQNGFVRIPSDSTDKSITVTATSVYDSTKKATATILVAENQE